MKKAAFTIIITLLFPFAIGAEGLFETPKNAGLIPGQDTAAIFWINPDNPDFDRVYLFRSSILIEDYFTYRAVEGLCDKIYEGREESFTAGGLAQNLDYWFILFASDRFGNYSRAIVMKKSQYDENAAVNAKEQSRANTLIGASSETVNEVSFNEAGIVYNYNRPLENPENSETRRLALFIIVKSPNDLSERDKNAISYFIDAGTPTTILLGAGERTGVLNSYLSVFDKLPTNQLDWQDVIKIANGRWPNQRNLDAEEKAADISFSAIYKRMPDMDNAFDNAAVTVIAYGLRPAGRNLDSERKAIDIYRSIFNKSPLEAFEWDMVRAIAYSGASR